MQTRSAGATVLHRRLAGFNDPATLDHYLNFSANAHTRDNRYGVDLLVQLRHPATRVLQQRISAFYNAQCCGLAFEYQRYNFAGVRRTSPVGPSLLPLVHARRPRQFLAVQRRAERRAALTAHATADAGHRRRRIRRQPSPRSARRATARTIVAWHRPGGRRRATVAGVDWQAVDMLDRAAVARRDRAMRPGRGLSLRRRGARRSGLGTSDGDARGQRARHASSASRRCATRRAGRRVLIPSSALVYAPPTDRSSEEHPLVPASPYGLSKLAQELVGAAQSAGHRVLHRAPVQPFRSAAGSVVRRRRHSRDRSPRSRPAAGAPEIRSAISTHGAI